MTDSQRLALVRIVHTIIYLVMVAAIFELFYAGITGDVSFWLWISVGLLVIESLVFVGGGMKCPLTTLAVRYGAEKGYAFDTFLPERFTRYTFCFFGSLMVLGFLLLLIQLLTKGF